MLWPPDISHLCWDGLLTGFTGHHGKTPNSIEESSHRDQVEGTALLRELCELRPPEAQHNLIKHHKLTYGLSCYSLTADNSSCLTCWWRCRRPPRCLWGQRLWLLSPRRSGLCGRWHQKGSELSSKGRGPSTQTLSGCRRRLSSCISCKEIFHTVS